MKKLILSSIFLSLIFFSFQKAQAHCQIPCGIYHDELRFEKITVEPLLIDRSCRYPLSGIVEITRADETMTIDYGTGECDNIAHVTKDGVTEEIELNSCQFRKGFQRHNKDMKQNKGWW